MKALTLIIVMLSTALLPTEIRAQLPVSPSPTKDKVALKVPLKALAFPLDRVRLLEGPFREALEREHEYLLRVDNDRLLHNFRVAAGLPSTAAPLSGWEEPGCELRGHFAGHYLSACALMYASTGDERLKKKAASLVDDLAKCQAPNGYLSAFPEEFIDRVEAGKRVWAPWYTLHKIYAGLLDMYTICDNDRALAMLEKASAWVKSRTDKLTSDQIQVMLKTEFGGMGEVLRNLYAVTGDADVLAVARRFDKRVFLDPLMDHRDELAGLHVNTHIPQAIAAAREYEISGDLRSYEAAKFFWDENVHARSYATGGVSNYEYWKDAPYRMADQLGPESHENCCTYNMLRLTEHVFSWSADPAAMDYYERALFNGILPTQMPSDAGALMYYVPMRSGLFKIWGYGDSSFYCCNGSGIESFAKFGTGIYSHDNTGVSVNLFVASELSWPERGLVLRQETRFPEEEGTSIILKLEKTTEFSLKIRIPSWVAGPAAVRVNGQPALFSSSPSSYLIAKRTWQDGDRVDVGLPMDLHLWRMPDEPSMSAIMYGPLVLVGAMGDEGMTKAMKTGYLSEEVDRSASRSAAAKVPDFVVADADPRAWIRSVEGSPLEFRTVNAGRPADVTLVPFYKLFGQRYSVYWNIYTEGEWKDVERSARELPPSAMDAVRIGEKRSERGHDFQAYVSERGTDHGRPWVRSSQWFRYDLDVVPGAPAVLKCTYWGEEKDCSFTILLDGRELASGTLTGEAGASFLEAKYPIPDELLRGKTRVAVMFRARDKKPTARLFGLEIDR